jgi:hypothetical protein
MVGLGTYFQLHPYSPYGDVMDSYPAPTVDLSQPLLYSRLTPGVHPIEEVEGSRIYVCGSWIDVTFEAEVGDEVECTFTDGWWAEAVYGRFILRGIAEGKVRYFNTMTSLLKVGSHSGVKRRELHVSHRPRSKRVQAY